MTNSPSCGTCRHWRRVTDEDAGVCIAAPPSPSGPEAARETEWVVDELGPVVAATGVWPITHMDERCGAYSPTAEVIHPDPSPPEPRD